MSCVQGLISKQIKGIKFSQKKKKKKKKKKKSEFCDPYAHARPISLYLLCCKFQIIILKTVRVVAETRTLLYHMYDKLSIKVNQGYASLTMIIRSEFCNIYAYAQPLSSLLCKFQSITLKTIGGVTETQTVL